MICYELILVINHLVIGKKQGLYTLNMNELHDACIDQLFPRRTSWIFVLKDILMSISGQKTPHLYRHDLVQIHMNCNKHSINTNTSKFGAQMDHVIQKIPDRFVPWKLSATIKIPNTKGVTRCCVGRNPYNGYKYLCGICPNTTGIFLMQWYNPLNKFMLLKVRFPELSSNMILTLFCSNSSFIFRQILRSSS